MRNAFLAVLVILVALPACGGKSGPRSLVTTDGTLGDGNVAGDAAETSAPADVVAEDQTEQPEDLVTPPEETVDATVPEDVPFVEDVPQPEEVVEETLIPDLSKEGDDCLDVFYCAMAKGCEYGDEACWAPCYADASAMTLWELSLIGECYEDNCQALPPEPGGGNCLWSQCFAELYVCIGGEGDASCEETLACQSECGDEDGTCIMDCMAKSNEEAITVALKIANAEDNANFFTYLFECVEGEGEGTCADMSACLDDCGMFSEEEEGEGNPLDIACTIDCIKESSADAKEMFLGIFECGEEPCADKLLECMGGAGDMTCEEALECIMTCGGEGGGEDDPPPPEDDEGGGDCFTDCTLQTSPEAHDKLMNYLECGAEICGEEMDGCPQQMACIPECTGGGDLSCGEVFTCAAQCETEGEDCFGECIIDISVEGAQDLADFLTCIDEKCPEGGEECPEALVCMALCPGIQF